MSASHGLYWRSDEARLKSFSTASNKAGATIKLELHVTDPLRLGFLLQELAEIQRDQDARPARAPAKAAAAPLLLTDRRGHDRPL